MCDFLQISGCVSQMIQNMHIDIVPKDHQYLFVMLKQHIEHIQIYTTDQ